LLGKEDEAGESRELLVEQLDKMNDVLDHMLDGGIHRLLHRTSPRHAVISVARVGRQIVSVLPLHP